jgi:Cys-tRNA(Pro)/Cys-tRNA(Cys) deacylase
MRRLDALGLAYDVKVYDADAAFHSAADAAALLHAPVETVYKTLVLLRERPGARPLLVLIPAAAHLGLKRLAAALGEKRLRMATQREAERLTGMQAGGISALGLQRPTFDVLVDESARALDRFHVSAGARGIDLYMKVDDFLRAAGAEWASVI